MRGRGKLRNPWIIKKERKKVQLKGIAPCPTEHRQRAKTTKRSRHKRDAPGEKKKRDRLSSNNSSNKNWKTKTHKPESKPPIGEGRSKSS